MTVSGVATIIGVDQSNVAIMSDVAPATGTAATSESSGTTGQNTISVTETAKPRNPFLNGAGTGPSQSTKVISGTVGGIIFAIVFIAAIAWFFGKVSIAKIMNTSST